MKSLSFKEIIILVVTSYISGIVSLPNFGLLSTLPLVFLLTLAAYTFCKKKLFVCIFPGFMGALLNMLYDFETSRAMFVFVMYTVFAYLAVMTFRGIKTVKYASKENDTSRKNKALIVSAVSVVIAVLFWNVSFGNIISAVAAQSENEKYVSENYGEKVKTDYTYYSAKNGEYLTNITFENANGWETYYVGNKNTDDCKAFNYELLKFSAAEYFKKNTTIAGDEILYFLDGEDRVYDSNNFELYKEEFEYLIPITQKVTGISSFKKMCESYLALINLSESFTYKTIIIVAEGVEGTVYKGVYNKGDMDMEYRINTEFSDLDRFTALSE